jgi:AAA domain
MAKPKEIKPAGPKPGDPITFFLYGHPGCGKTRLVSSGGSDVPTLIVRPFTDHTDSVRTAGVEEWEVHDWSEMYNVHEFLRHEGAKHYRWVWLDSVSLFQDTGLDDIWEGVTAKYPHRKEYSLDKGEYGINMWRLQTWIRDVVGIRDLNFGITAHPEQLFSPITQQTMLQPYVQGKNMTTKIQGYCNVVGYLEVVQQKSGEPRRVLRVRGTEDYTAKDQYDAFPNGRLVDPDMAKFEEHIEAAIAQNQANTSPRRRPVRRSAARRRGQLRSAA